MTKRRFKIHLIIIIIAFIVILLLYLPTIFSFDFIKPGNNSPTLLTESFSPDSSSRIEIYQYNFNKHNQSQIVQIRFYKESPVLLDGILSQKIETTITNLSEPLNESNYYFQWIQEQGTVTIITSDKEERIFSLKEYN